MKIIYCAMLTLCIFSHFRQEYLGMQAKYNALENRSKDMLVAQGSAVSGANVALASLQSRIEHLVEQLISSYNISEQDLEVSAF